VLIQIMDLQVLGLFFVKFNFSIGTVNSPSSNKPIKCPNFKHDFIIWSYNLTLHYHECHIGMQPPLVVTDTEIIRLQNFKK